jgi:hypothetical protein
MSHFFTEAAIPRDTRCVTFSGRHYETGAISNTLQAMGAVDPHTGQPYSEALAFGASGGIAFGNFVFEYKGHLPHVALLTRNTFSPFEMALDNLAVRRETRETTHVDKAEKNLRLELDSGNPVVVWADVFSMPYRGLNPEMMWQMQPVLVVGQDGEDFLLADGSRHEIRIAASDLERARARVKKDRFRIMTLEKPDVERVPEGLRRGIATCTALFLDKPPAGSPNNFGIVGMRHWSQMLTDSKNAKGWPRTFEPGPRLTQALAGQVGQPGVWDWIETWGTAGGGDRATYAQFLREASTWLNEPRLQGPAEVFSRSEELWHALADAAMPDAVPEFARLKALKREHSNLWFEQGANALDARMSCRAEIKQLVAELADPAKLAPLAGEIQANMASLVDQIADLEEPAIRELRSIVE